MAVLVGGGIAAYKLADLVSQLVQAGCEVRVAMTEAARRFVGAASFHGLTGRPVAIDLWTENGPAEPHVELGDWADVILVAPATADLLARAALGLAGDMVTATLLAARCPVVVAPAMNDAMWAKAQVRHNLERLREAGVLVVEPESGPLASGHQGTGRLAAAQAVVDGLAEALRARFDLAGRRVVVTAGGTREPVDSVRFLGNRSSGKMGFALAGAAARRGALVTLISTVPPPTELAELAGRSVSVVPVETAAEMLEALLAHAPSADLLFMAAAVADFRPATRFEHKLHREDGVPPLELEPNPDLLVELGRVSTPGLYKVGFAAEDADLAARATGKLIRKGLDAIVANDITVPGIAMGSDDNEVTVHFAGGETRHLPRMAKVELAERLIDLVLPRLGRP